VSILKPARKAAVRVRKSGAGLRGPVLLFYRLQGRFSKAESYK